MKAPTVLAVSRTDRIWTWVLLLGGGAVLGAAAYLARGLWLAHDWLPWREIVLFTVGLGPWALPLFVAAGLVAGLVLTVMAIQEEVTVTVDVDEVTIADASSTRRHRGPDVREATLDGRHLVLVAHNGTELTRKKTGHPASALEAAFRDHGYRWTS